MAEEGILKREPPHDLESEQAVIASMLMDRENINRVSEVLTKDDFYHQQYGLIYESILELNEEGKPVDQVILQNRLREKNLPPEYTSIEFLTGLVVALPTQANLMDYADLVAKKALLRRVIKVCSGIEQDCFASEGDVNRILDKTEADLMSLIQKRTTDSEEPIMKVVVRAIEKIEAAGKNSGNVTGVATGFLDLDRQTAGLQPSDLILLAARPSMGKTALALNIAEYVAFHEKQCVAIFSLEMSKDQLVNRLFSLESRVDAQKLRTGNLNEGEWSALMEGAETIAHSELIIDDKPGISIGELRSKCRKYKMEHDLKLILIDYLQLMSGSGRADSRQQEVSEISRSLKALARELNVPVVALSQLSRAVESRPDHRPMMSDLRESGAIEQDADLVMFLYRDEYYHPDSEHKGEAEVIIAKQRNGPIGTIKLYWQAAITRFVNKEKSYT
jgi:replicative DNA helicase